ncbi:MAG TPA: hypothetical protein VOA41_14575 [Candidatus Dormibacteraeota bacterium]|nr:hypothetical protein [Candidatus Dormibacteraeota bacterium]
MTPWIKKYRLTKQEVAEILQDFLDGRGRPLAWDGFTLGMSFEDEYLENIRIRCANLSQEYPPEHPNEYCNEQGRNVICEYIKQLTAAS